MEEILDLDSFCRFCLKNLEEAVTISDKIQEFFENLTNIEVISNICPKIPELKRFSTFRC